jgi:hypothetical protein
MIECPECYCNIRYLIEPHNCPCIDEIDEGFIDDWELQEE